MKTVLCPRQNRPRIESKGLGSPVGARFSEGGLPAIARACSASLRLACCARGAAQLAPRWALNHPKKERIMSKCKYCGSSSFGSCSNSPHKKHEHSGLDEKKCVFCGSSSYGSCSKSPFNKHQHGSGNYKCVYCGSTSTGSCSNSPHGKHEK